MTRPPSSTPLSSISAQHPTAANTHATEPGVAQIAALPTIVQHLKALEAGRLVSSAKIGRVRTYQLVPDAFGTAIDWLHRQRPSAQRQVDRLTALLVESTKNPEGEQQ
ncbi:ArsR/SmtB family transcription factor [Nocardia sp. NPDC058658]|uniref:ArsR/SmtB family transcription factor n=1 Tax=Nocardia sp. NPDC058658 TaxID=3346580 RepID=UPI00365D754D